MARGNNKRQASKINIATRNDDDDPTPAQQAAYARANIAAREKKREWFEKLDKSSLSPEAIAYLKKDIENLDSSFSEATNWTYDQKSDLIAKTLELKYFDKLNSHPEGRGSKEKLEKDINAVIRK